MKTVTVSSREYDLLLRDAKRYRFLRDEDNWGQDTEELSWHSLGEATLGEFDLIVDEKMNER